MKMEGEIVGREVFKQKGQEDGGEERRRVSQN